MATSNNDRISSAKLATFAAKLWAKIKNLFLSKSDFESSPAGKILEIPYNSKDYTLAQLIDYANNGYSIFCVASGHPKMALVNIVAGPGNIDIATFVGPYVPSTNYAYTATMNNNKDWSVGTTNYTAYWGNVVNKPESFPPSTHSHQISDVSQLSSALDNKLFSSASNATSDTLWNLSAAGDEVTNVFDNTRLLATGVNADGGFSFLRFSTLRDKIKTYLGFSATTGKLADANIESASTWNGKMNSSGSNATASGIGNIIQKAQYYTASDFPTNLGDPQIGVLFRDASGNVNSSGRINLENFESLLKSDIKEWPSAQELYKSDRGNVWFMSCSKNQVYRLTMPSNKDCGLASLFVHTTAANGWPLIFQVGWRWGGSSFSAVPHLAYIYTTSQNSEDKMVTVKYSGDCLYICINQTQTQRRALFSLISDNVDSIEFDVISQTLSDYTQATAVAAGNTEGCVMKESIGTKIGDVNRPVYVNEAGFIRPCNYYFS